MSDHSNALIGGHDAPLSSREDDLLNRWSVARAIDRVISNAPQGWSTRIGLYGPWGAGKTSVLKFLRTLAEERGDIVVEFSAWQSQGEGGVLQLFHQELLSVLRTRSVNVEPRSSWLKRKLSGAANVGHSVGSASAEVGAAVEADVGQLISIAGMAMSMASGALGGLVRLGAADLDRLQKALGTRRVLVFVDDLDRADPRVVPKTLLALRELLDWPNFAFVLAFDKSVVASALGEYSKAFGQSADDFLEKVVDVPFELPEPTPEQVSALALNAMEVLCSFIPIEARRRVAPLFPANPRQAKQVVRVLSALKLAAERHDPTELNWSGIMMQTVLRLAAPDVASVFEARVLGADFGQWDTPEERKAAVASAVNESIAADRRLTDISKGNKQRRTEWLNALMSDIRTVRRNDGADRLAYEMRLGLR